MSEASWIVSHDRITYIAVLNFWRRWIVYIQQCTHWLLILFVSTPATCAYVDHARNQSYVAQKYYRAQQHPIIFITLVSSHQILKNESYYTFIQLVLSHYRLKNEIYYIRYLLRICAT